MLDRGGNSFEINNGAFAGVKIEDLAQCDVERADTAADGCGERTLDGNTKITDSVDSVVGEPLLISIECLFAREDFVPRNFAFTAIGVLDSSVENPARSLPDVAAGAIAFDEGDDGIVRNQQFAAAVTDRRAIGWNWLPVVAAFHCCPTPETISRLKIEPRTTRYLGTASLGAPGRTLDNITSCRAAKTCGS